MKNVLDKFNSIVELADKANKAIARNNYEGTIGYGPRFRKMMHFNNRRVHSVGIYDYLTKRYVIFELVNMVGQSKHSVPKELRHMERLILDAKIA
jgi:hypothetical protein|tara:strand:- start:14441 stop:14725 length:285 start_codon:yes stop_codon:yes gene_type:complete